ncbi:YHYH protein [Yoonia tamlensis]|uniref:YHYH protein n=1 Tax=Yoonia tamlensis TaxID=390270 RepID=A0A1I6GQD2_9RHOB|nr:YHYH protein [Yoonia tamlensis]SFR44329.1 YHYH protein [Yoonia tamlensis]
MRKQPKIILSLLTAATLCAPSLGAAHGIADGMTETALVAPAQIVDCTLENGTAAQCTQLVVNYVPEGLEIGPFCPATIDGESGIWDWTGENAGIYRVDRSYFEMLDELGYRFFDDDGTVHIADISVAQPVDDHACINVSVDETVTMTLLIPTTPVMADAPSRLGTVSKVGVGLDGVPIFSDAPSIQQTGHMPVLDTCGGHVDPGGWYHWHATATDIATVYDAHEIAAECGLTQDSSAQFGYAFDGFAMYGSTDIDGTVPTDLDTCNGHIGETEYGADAVYHYHATTDFPNLPGCLVGVQAQDNFVTTAQAGVGANPPEGTVITRGEPPRGDGPGGAPEGFDEAAQTLGRSVEELMQVLDAAGGPQLDFGQAATALGVTEDALRSILPPPPNR